MKFLGVILLACGAMVVFTLLLAYVFSQAAAEVRCTYKTVTETHSNGSVSTTQRETCVERTVNGKSAPAVSNRNLTELEKKIRRPGCYKKDPDGYIVADPQCPAWIAYLRETDQRNGLVPYSTRKHNRFKKDFFGAFLTLVFN